MLGQAQRPDQHVPTNQKAPQAPACSHCRGFFRAVRPAATKNSSTVIGSNAPNSLSPPNFSSEQIAMVLRKLATAIGRQSSDRRSSGNTIQCDQHAPMVRLGVCAPQHTQFRPPATIPRAEQAASERASDIAVASERFAVVMLARWRTTKVPCSGRRGALCTEVG
jgi:hypothetical protein